VKSIQAAIFSWALLLMPEAYGAAASETLVVSESTVCHAKVFSQSSIILPGHCLENSQALIFEDLGRRTIKRISPFGQQSPLSKDNLTRVELTEPVFSQAKQLVFATARPGDAKIIAGGREMACRIFQVDPSSKTFSHNCADRKGQSGKTIFQNAQPVGIHLGKLRDLGVAVAAMKDGPDFSQNPERFASYEPQGLKISCCKKLDKAVSNMGAAIADGAEALQDLAEKAGAAIAAEVAHLKDELAILPKVFSVNYVEDKVAEVRLPKVSAIKIDSSLIQTTFNWEQPDLKWPDIALPEIGRNSVIAKLGRTLDKAYEDSDRALTKAGRDIRRWPKDTNDWLKTLGGGINYPDDCENLAREDQKQSCIAGLEAKIQNKEAELKRLRGAVDIWLDQQRSILNME
jgi:hypothetical protein